MDASPPVKQVIEARAVCDEGYNRFQRTISMRRAPKDAINRRTCPVSGRGGWAEACFRGRDNGGSELRRSEDEVPFS